MTRNGVYGRRYVRRRFDVGRTLGPAVKFRSGRRRRGAAVLEMALVLALFLIVTMGLIDLGIGVFRYHVLSQAARHVARRAIVHGELATALGPWGAGTIDVNANASGIPAVGGDANTAGVQNQLIGCDRPQTRIVVAWPDGDNEVGDRVQVTITSPYRPMFSFILSGGQITLTGRSTMRIAH